MSLLTTRMQNMRAEGRLDKNENRPSRYGAIDFVIQDTDAPGGIITEDLKQKAFNSIGSTLETPVLNYDAGVAIGNIRNAVIADSENTSALQTITFATYSWGFTITPSLYMNNEVSMQQDFERKFSKYLYKFAETLDNAAINALEANRTQVFEDSLTYVPGLFSLQADWVDRERVISDVEPIMEANDHFGQIHMVGNGGVQSIINHMAQHGQYNDQNKILSFAGKGQHYSNRIDNDVSAFGTFYAVLEGSTGILTRVEREAVMATKSRTGHEWGIELLPMLNMPVGTYYYEGVSDQSALAGAASADMTRAHKQHYGFAVDVAIVTNYNSDIATIANPIMKFEILSEV